MKLIHLSDLHLGKRVNEFSMIEDQKYILKSILRIIDDERPQAVVIAGDIYDKSQPSEEAVNLFDDFLVRLSKRDTKVFIISGNHDSAERLAFGNRLIEKTGIFLSPVYRGKISWEGVKDEYGQVRIHMLPFIKPTNVRRAFPEAEIKTYTDAVRTAVENMDIEPGTRNVLVAHQFVTGAKRSESEEISVGGSDNVDASVFEAFDYVALGHLHRTQNAGSEKIRYCGTPLKYSFSEAGHEKSVTVVEMDGQGRIRIRCVPLEPMHDMVELRGSYEELSKRSFCEERKCENDYVHVTLTDEESIPNAMNNLRKIYKNIMLLDYDNTRTRSRSGVCPMENMKTRSPMELFAELYQKQNGSDMSAKQNEYISKMIEKIWEDHG